MPMSQCTCTSASVHAVHLATGGLGTLLGVKGSLQCPAAVAAGEGAAPLLFWPDAQVGS